MTDKLTPEAIARREQAVADGFCCRHPLVKRGSHNRYCDACVKMRAESTRKYRNNLKASAPATAAPRKATIRTKLMGEHWRATDGTTAMWGATEAEAVARLKAKLDDTP